MCRCSMLHGYGEILHIMIEIIGSSVSHHHVTKFNPVDAKDLVILLKRHSSLNDHNL